MRWCLFTSLLLGLASPLVAQDAAEQPTTKDAPPLFLDATKSSGLDFVHWNGMTGRYYFPEVVGSGGALFDMDGDGDLDLYLVQGGRLGPTEHLAEATFPPPGPLPLSDRLLRNDLGRDDAGRPVVRWTDVSDAAGIDAPHYGMGVATGDVDNDGDIDLYVTNFGPNQLWLNQGPGPDGIPRFEEVATALGVAEPAWSVPATFADLDADGWIDLFVGNYMEYSVARNKSCVGESGLRDYCGPQSYEAIPDRLFHNQGPGKDGRVRFADITKSSGVAESFGPALGAVAADFDGDGWIDLYVGNDQAANQLWLNQGPGDDGSPRFFDDALLLGAALNQDGAAEASMGIDAADVDSDGDEDLFMTHLTRESNTLYVNDGKGLFHDRSLKSGLANASWSATGFGTAFLDVDNDSWLDLLAVNGSVYILFELARQGDPYPLHQPNQLFRNLGPERDGIVRFEEISQQGGEALELSEVSRGALFGDVDNDGDTDVVVTNNSGPARLLLSTATEQPQPNHWLGLRLVAGEPLRDQLGARVALHIEGRPPIWRRARSDGSYASANDPRVLVGLGQVAKVETVEVHWPGGEAETWPAPTIDQYHTLEKGKAPPPTTEQPTTDEPATDEPATGKDSP